MLWYNFRNTRCSIKSEVQLSYQRHERFPLLRMNYISIISYSFYVIDGSISASGVFHTQMFIGHIPGRSSWPWCSAGCWWFPHKWFLRERVQCVNIKDMISDESSVSSWSTLTLTDLTVSVVFLNGIVFGEAHATHPLDALGRGQSRHLRTHTDLRTASQLVSDTQSHKLEKLTLCGSLSHNSDLFSKLWDINSEL